jgi:ferredoxin
LSGFANLDVTLAVENAGYESVCVTTGELIKPVALAAGLEDNGEYITVYGVVLTTAPFSKYEAHNLQEPVLNPKKSLADNLRELLLNENSHNFAAAEAKRFDKLADKLKEIKGGEHLLLSKDKNTIHIPYDPVVSSVERRINKPSDYLKSAHSVIIFGLPFPDMVTKMAMKPPAYAVGPYVFATYQTMFELEYSGLKLCKYLQDLGYEAVMTHDLTGIGGDVGSPRGLLYDAVSNSLEAVEAGIGVLTKNGVCYTSQHGFNQRFMAVITDAPIGEFLYESPVNYMKADRLLPVCEECDKCISVCPAKALEADKAVDIELNGRPYRWIPSDAGRCEWSKKHALCAEDGIKYTGSLTNTPVPADITEESLDSALRNVDSVFKARPTIAERCITECPLVNK